MNTDRLVRVRAHGPFFWRQQRLAALARRRTEAVSLGDYVRLAGRYRRLLATCLALGLIAGVVAAGVKPANWVSGVTVLATPVALDPQTPPDKIVRPRNAVSIDTEAAIILSYLVLPRAVAGTSLTPADLARETTLTAAPNSQVIRIQVQDRNPVRAQLLATNLASTYLAVRQRLLSERRTAQVTAVQKQIAALAALEAAPGHDEGSLGSEFAIDVPIDDQLNVLRTQLAELDSAEISGGEVLRSATAPRQSPRQPQVQIISFTLLGLVLGGLLIAFRERRPSAPRTAADIHHLPICGDLPVALLGRNGPVDDGQGGWVGIADAIGPAPAATLIISLDDEPLGEAVHALSMSLRRRGYAVIPLGGSDHESPADDGATAQMLAVRGGGRHLVGAGPALPNLEASLSTTQTDYVVLMVAPGAVSERELDAAIDRVVHLGITVIGVILDLAHARHSRLARLTRAAS
jgi:hypothetical protein